MTEKLQTREQFLLGSRKTASEEEAELVEAMVRIERGKKLDGEGWQSDSERMRMTARAALAKVGYRDDD